MMVRTDMANWLLMSHNIQEPNHKVQYIIYLFEDF